MTKIFVDTSALIALFVVQDQGHITAKNKYRDYVKENSFFSTNFEVIGETYTKITTSLGGYFLKIAVNKINELEKIGTLNIFQIDAVAFKESEKIMLKFSEHRISFTDATIYYFVKEYRLDEVFTLDSDFKKIGLKTSF